MNVIWQKDHHILRETVSTLILEAVSNNILIFVISLMWFYAKPINHKEPNFHEQNTSNEDEKMSQILS